MSTGHLFLSIVIGVFASGNFSQAQEPSTENFDELIQGFEDDPNSATPSQQALDNPDMEELLEGFEDSSDAGKTATQPTAPSRW